MVALPLKVVAIDGGALASIADSQVRRFNPELVLLSG